MQNFVGKTNIVMELIAKVANALPSLDEVTNVFYVNFDGLHVVPIQSKSDKMS